MNWQIRPVSLKVKQHSLKFIWCHFHLAACQLAIYHSPFRQHLCFKCVSKKKKSICLTSLSIGLNACVPNKRLITLVNHLQRGSFFLLLYIVLSPQEISANELPQGKSPISQIFLWRWSVLLNSGM